MNIFINNHFYKEYVNGKRGYTPQMALEVVYHLGVRTGPSELLYLKCEDVDLDKGKVRIYAPKNKIYRTNPIKDKKFLEELREQRDIADTPYVILNTMVNPLRARNASFIGP